ncbi:MAG: hypothetical protein K0Q79_1294 [Flavipsychrobacter sp.]|jgi:hypothetical protein|nr:hypothetical protein [Flavipsychrobacter sp.]
MKRIILLELLILFGSHNAIAQTDTVIYLTIADPTSLVSVAQVTDTTVMPEFDNEDINDIVDNYTFKEFKQAFPTSRFLSSRQVYAVIASSTAVAAELAGALHQACIL